MSDFLADMSAESARRAGVARDAIGVAELRSRAEAASPPIALTLAPGGFDVIAEVKLASPSEGRLVSADADADRIVDLAATYAGNGAVAISVLSEETRFDGSIDHVAAVAGTVSIPVLRKDFLVDPVQILEARAAGASGVLLIARMLPGEVLEEMTDEALESGMFVIVEVFDRSDLETAVVVFDREVLVGVNSRDLSTLEVDRSRFETLAPHLPDHLPAVAESGLGAPGEVAFVASLSYRLALVGSALVTDADPGRRLRDLLAAGRNALTAAER